MRTLPIFVPTFQADSLYREVWVEVRTEVGLATGIRRMNIAKLHAAGKAQHLTPLLEVSTLSELELGRSLSAFNLLVKTPKGPLRVENLYQGSKIFEGGGPFQDLYFTSPVKAKQDLRLKKAQKTPFVGYRYFDEDWPAEPRTGFFTWLYLTALKQWPTLFKGLEDYSGFTDIHFHPERGINCQARCCAIAASLKKLGLLNDVLASREAFLALNLDLKELGGAAAAAFSEATSPAISAPKPVSVFDWVDQVIDRFNVQRRAGIKSETIVRRETTRLPNDRVRETVEYTNGVTFTFTRPLDDIPPWEDHIPDLGNMVPEDTDISIKFPNGITVSIL